MTLETNDTRTNSPHRRYAVLAFAGVAWLTPGFAAACAPAPVGAKDFAVAGAPLPSAVSLNRGKLTIGVPPGQFGALLDAHPASARAEYCAQTSAPAGGDDRDAGLAFWATRTGSGAPHDFYAFTVGPRGNWSVQRAVDGHVHLVASGAATKPSTGGAVSHEVRVKLDGRLATLTLDGARLGSFEGAPPPGTSYSGLFAEASASQGTPWTFADVHTGTH